jgi:hypothetical protein
MVAPVGALSQNSSSRYLTIRGSEASDAWTPSDRPVWNLNPDFNAIWLQTIMESIQRMVPEGSPLISLAQQGAEAAGHVVAPAQSAGNQRGETSIGNRSDDQAKHPQSHKESLPSGNRNMVDNDTCWRITQNSQQRKYRRDRDDLRNVINERRHVRARSPTPP